LIATLRRIFRTTEKRRVHHLGFKNLKSRLTEKMYEHRHEPVLTRIEFFFRVLWHGALALGVLAVALGIGVLGYYSLEPGMSGLDALLNASMILGGMGPVTTLVNPRAKVFASAYALFSGVVFISLMGIMLGPFAHRVLHRFHWDRGGKG
jgi:hypothetical protein